VISVPEINNREVSPLLSPSIVEDRPGMRLAVVDEDVVDGEGEVGG